MKKVKHWLHILLALLTGGLWLPVYVIVIATTEMFNRGYRAGKAAGRVEKSNEYEAERLQPNTAWAQAPARTFVDDLGRRVIVGADGEMRFGCTMTPVVPIPKGVSSFDRFKELGDRMLSGDPLDSYEQLEYQELRKEVVR